MGRYSEEQWKSMKLKITAGVILLVIVSTAYLLGPGLSSVWLARARENDDAELMYRVAAVAEWTFRREMAKEIYEEFYERFAGDEEEVTGLEIVAEKMHGGDYRKAYFIHWIEREQTEGKPHPLLPKVLIRYAEYWEDHREYPKSNHIYRSVKRCFPDTQAAADAEQALKRDALRSY